MKKQLPSVCAGFLNNDEKKSEDNSNSSTQSPQTILKVSKIIFDEKTGTITLKLASEEEIAKVNEQSQEPEDS